MKSDLQLRGHCQCCGREQAVTSGTIAKHGYKVDNGWFNGVCVGAGFEPIEKDITQSKTIINNIKEDIVKLTTQLSKLESGKLLPSFVTIGFSKNKIEIPFSEANAVQQKQAVNSAIWNTKGRISLGNNFITNLEVSIDSFHGKELRQVAKPTAAEPIQVGEKRVTTNGLTLTCTKVDGARVYWKSETKRGWTGTTSWRKFKKI